MTDTRRAIKLSISTYNKSRCAFLLRGFTLCICVLFAFLGAVFSGVLFNIVPALANPAEIEAEIKTGIGGYDTNVGIIQAHKSLDRQALAPVLSYFTDETNSLTINEIVNNNQFRPLMAPSIELDFSDSTYWFRFSVKNSTPRDLPLILELRLAYLRSISAFYRSPGGEYIESHAGLEIPFTARDVQDSYQALPINAFANQTTDIYIKLKHGMPLSLTPLISHINHYLSHKYVEQLFSSLFYGIAFGLIGYNLLLFFTTRQFDFGCYAAYVFCCLGVFSTSYDGIAYRYWPSIFNGLDFYIVYTLTCSAVIFDLLFTRFFLNTKQKYPRLHKINTLGIVLCLLCIPYVYLGSFDQTTVTISTIVGVLYLYLVMQGVVALKWDRESAYYHLSGHLCLFLIVLYAIVASPLFTSGEIPFNFLEFTYACFVLQLFILSIGLINKLNIQRRKELKAQEQLDRLHLANVDANMIAAVATAKNESATQFIAAMSHEIRTPMNGVLGITELLCDTELDKNQRELANTIKNSGSALLSIINDIVIVQEQKRQKLIIKRQATDIENLIRESLSLFTANLTKNIDFTYSIDKVVPRLVTIDSNRVRQILINLIGNAIKFTQQGDISIEVQLGPHEKSQINALKRESFITISVIDEGIGISPAQLSRIFESFAQADVSVTRKYGGSGLGLSISKNLVESMGGEIGVKSKLGSGSCFWFSIPHTRAIGESTNADTTAALLSAQDERFFALRVLAAEDNAVNRIVLQGMLNKLGIKARFANNGEEVIELYVQNNGEYDLILMDCEMPLIDGFEAARRIREFEAQHQLNKVPIIAVSAHALESYRQQALSLGFCDYIFKPFSAAQLKSSILQTMT